MRVQKMFSCCCKLDMIPAPLILQSAILCAFGLCRPVQCVSMSDGLGACTFLEQARETQSYRATPPIMCLSVKSLTHVRSKWLVLASRQQVRTVKQVTRATPSESELPPPDVRKLAQLAQLSVTDEEIKEWEPKIQSILGWFAQLQQADVSHVEPAVRADINIATVLRDDVPVEYDNREALLAEVPEREGAFVKVPKIM